MIQRRLDQLRRWVATLGGPAGPPRALRGDARTLMDAEVSANVASDVASAQAASARVATQTAVTILEESRRLAPVLTEILSVAGQRVVPGATTLEVANALFRECRRRDLEPAMLGYRGFPSPAAISVNDEIVHGLPSSRVLEPADLVKVEFGVVSGTAFASQSWTFAVDRVTPHDEVMLVAGRRALAAAVSVVSPEHRLGDIGAAIQDVVEGAGLSVVRAFVGYGMGKLRIQGPQIDGVGMAGRGARLRPGMILNLHVIIKHGSPEVQIAGNRWTALAEDGRRGALFTSMVEVTSHGHAELTPFLDP